MYATDLVTLFLAFTNGVVFAAHTPSESSHSKTQTGDLTFYAPGLGACGKHNTAKDLIAAVPPNIFAQL